MYPIVHIQSPPHTPSASIARFLHLFPSFFSLCSRTSLPCIVIFKYTYFISIPLCGDQPFVMLLLPLPPFIKKIHEHLNQSSIYSCLSRYPLFRKISKQRAMKFSFFQPMPHDSITPSGEFLTRIASGKSIWGSCSKKGRLLENQ